MADELPRGVRNCNPGNLEHGAPWQGLAKVQTDDRFCTFVSPAWGFRAIAMTLCTYQDKYGIKTIDAAIRRWAPANENDTQAYISAVAVDAHRGPNDPINFHDYNEAYPVIRAITIHENGAFEKYFSKSQLDVGCIKAGLENAPKGVLGSVLKGGAVAAGTAAGYVASDPVGAVTTAAGTFSSLRPILDASPEFLKTAFWGVAATIFGAVVIGEIIHFKNRKG